MRKIFLSSLWILPLAVVLGIALAALAFLLPPADHDSRVLPAADIIRAESPYPLEVYSQRMLDNDTDSLMLLEAADTGENFWWILLPAVMVVAVVQVLQDTVLVPKIMGSAMGLNPAVILLALSVWGSLLGFIGLIIALPLTTLLISYYKRFVLEESDTQTP